MQKVVTNLGPSLSCIKNNQQQPGDECFDAIRTLFTRIPLFGESLREIFRKKLVFSNVGPSQIFAK